MRLVQSHVALAVTAVLMALRSRIAYTYGFFDGEPPYDDVRKEVLEIVEGARRPITSGHRPLNQGTSPQGGEIGTSAPLSKPR